MGSWTRSRGGNSLTLLIGRRIQEWSEKIRQQVFEKQCLLLWADIMPMPPGFVPYLSLMPQALILSAQKKIGVYDCLYVALAMRLQFNRRRARITPS